MTRVNDQRLWRFVMLDLKKVRMVTLCENTTTNPFTLAEWGLSIHIEAGDERILYDTGAGSKGIILHNADVLGVDLVSIDEIVLSHGHQDHTGGLKDVLMRTKYQGKNRKVDIHCHPQALDEVFVSRPPSTDYWYFGFSHVQSDLERFGAVFKTSREPVWLTDDVVISGEIPMTNDYETVGEVFGVRAGDGIVKDTEMMDEKAMYIKTEKGLIVVLGCAHRGTINTIHDAQKTTGVEDVYMVIGGTHLANVPEYRMTSTIDELKRLKIKKLGVSHCTGMKESARLAGVFGPEVFFFNNVSTIVSHV